MAAATVTSLSLIPPPWAITVVTITKMDPSINLVNIAVVMGRTFIEKLQGLSTTLAIMAAVPGKSIALTMDPIPAVRPRWFSNQVEDGTRWPDDGIFFIITVQGLGGFREEWSVTGRQRRFNLVPVVAALMMLVTNFLSPWCFVCEKFPFSCLILIGEGIVVSQVIESCTCTCTIFWELLIHPSLKWV